MSLNRREFMKKVAVGSHVAIAGLTGCAERRGRRPNIIFLTADTTRFDRMGFNGYSRNATTPFLDTIADRGVNFTQCYAQASLTFPSVASFMSSKHPHSLGIHGNFTINDYIRPGTTLLADILRELGYTTVGASSVLWLGPRNGLDNGFDCFSFEAGKSECQRDSKQTLASAKSMLEQVSRDVPLFLWFHSFDAHIPYDHENVFGAGPAGVWPEPGERAVLLDEIPDGRDRRTEGLVFLERYKGFGTKEDIALLNQLYDSQIAYMDSVFKELLTFMSRNNLYDPERDVVICNADHGELMGEHGFCSVHGKPWHEITHVPLLLAGGGLPRGASVGQLVGNLDIVPTLLQIVAPDRFNELKKRLVFEGRSMLPAVLDEQPVRERVLTDFTFFSGLTSFDGRYKVIARRALKPSVTRAERNPDWALSGAVHFTDSQGIFRFEIPKDIFAGREAVYFELTLRSLHLKRTKTLSGRLTAPVFDLVLCHTQDDWDTCLVPWGPREWKLVLTDEKGQQIYDSETEHAWVAFEPLASPDYDLEVYDFKHDFHEETNIARELPEELVQGWIEDIIEEFERHSGSSFSNVVLKKSRLKDFCDQRLENIKDLGYL